MQGIPGFMSSKRGLSFLVLLVTLALGITIGSVVSDGVFSAEQGKTPVAPLIIKGEGTPSVLDEAVSLREGFARVAETVEPAVVNISTQSMIRRRSGAQFANPMREFFGDDLFRRFFDPDQQDVPDRQKRTSLGSGVVVDPAGYVLTNNHVVAPIEMGNGNRRVADKIEVQFADGETYVATVVGRDQESDLAVLKLKAKDDQAFPYAKVGDSSELKVGDWVVAIGSPFGLAQTVTAGIVSATKRTIPDSTIFGDYVQTDAAINPGNSGGPLVNLKGEVVGINTMITTNTGSFLGVGFAVPSAVFVNSYNQLVTTGRIERGWLGVSMNTFPMTPEMAEYFGVKGVDPGGVKDGDGVVVTQLINESGEPGTEGPAARAGIEVEDVIVKFGKREVEELYDLRSAVANTPPGETVPVVVVRKGEVLNLPITLAERTLEERRRTEDQRRSFDEKPAEEAPPERGLEFKTLSRRDARQAGIEDETGVVLTHVTPGSLADDAGLRAGLIVTHVNGKPVADAESFETTVLSVPSGGGVVLRVVAPNGDGTKSVYYTSFRNP